MEEVLVEFFCVKCDEDTDHVYFPYEPSDVYNVGGPECYQCIACQNVLFPEDVYAD